LYLNTRHSFCTVLHHLAVRRPHYLLSNISFLCGSCRILVSQAVFPNVTKRTMLSSLLSMQSLLQLLGLGSTYLLFLGAVPPFVALSLGMLLNDSLVVSLWTYVLSLVIPLLTGMQMTCVVLDVFVPLVRPLRDPHIPSFTAHLL
jgi:hypothetical protein